MDDGLKIYLKELKDKAEETRTPEDVDLALDQHKTAGENLDPEEIEEMMEIVETIETLESYK